MAQLIFRGEGADFAEHFSQALKTELEQAGLDEQLELSIQTEETPQFGNPRGADIVTWTAVAVAAVGASGALTTFLSKESVLASFAEMIEKIVDSGRANVVIEKKNGDRVEVSGPVDEIRDILTDIRDGEVAETTSA